MMLTKLVIRLLDADQVLLGWAEVEGHARGDGKIWVNAPTVLPITDPGKPKYVSVHWCDVNVEIRSEIADIAQVVVGDTITLPGEWAAITCGPAAGGLPPVTVRSNVEIGVPVGALGALTH